MLRGNLVCVRKLCNGQNPRAPFLAILGLALASYYFLPLKAKVLFHPCSSMYSDIPASFPGRTRFASMHP